MFGLSMRPAAYIVVWVADDMMESDRDPAVDGGSGANDPGRGVVRVRADGFSSRGSHRAVDALVISRCRMDGSRERCERGSRVQSWRLPN